VGSQNVLAGESPIKKQIFERFFIDLANRFFFHKDSDKTELG
jgi:hypothetical protein